MSQRDMSRIARAAQALRELTIDDLLAVSREASVHVLAASDALNAIPAHDWTVEVHPGVLTLVRGGKRIQAIKLQRELTSMGLEESMDFVARIAL